jgi:hypothetical protein
MEKVSPSHLIRKPQSVIVTADDIIITIDNQEYVFKIASLSSSLANASDAIKKHFVLSPSGYGLHWPDIDEDISIPALLSASL